MTCSRLCSSSASDAVSATWLMRKILVVTPCHCPNRDSSAIKHQHVHSLINKPDARLSHPVQYCHYQASQTPKPPQNSSRVQGGDEVHSRAMLSCERAPCMEEHTSTQALVDPIPCTTSPDLGIQRFATSSGGITAAAPRKGRRTQHHPKKDAAPPDRRE